MVVLTAAVLAVTTTAAMKQKSALPKHGALVTVIERRHLANNAHTVIELHAHQSPSNVVLVDPDQATPDELASSFSTVSTLRARFGDTLANDIRAVPKANHGASKTPPGQTAKRARMQKYLTALSSRREANVNGYGSVKSIHVALSSK